MGSETNSNNPSTVENIPGVYSVITEKFNAISNQIIGLDHSNRRDIERLRQDVNLLRSDILSLRRDFGAIFSFGHAYFNPTSSNATSFQPPTGPPNVYQFNYPQPHSNTSSQALNTQSTMPQPAHPVSMPSHAHIPPPASHPTPAINPTPLGQPAHNPTPLTQPPHNPTPLGQPAHNSTPLTQPPHNPTPLVQPAHNPTPLAQPGTHTAPTSGPATTAATQPMDQTTHQAAASTPQRTTSQPPAAPSSTPSPDPAQPTRSKTNYKISLHTIPDYYRLDRKLTKITDVWKEYEHGLTPEIPSVKLLNEYYRAAWRRDRKENRLYSRRKEIYEYIQKMADRDRISCEEAAVRLEERRVQLNISVDKLRKLIKYNDPEI